MADQTVPRREAVTPQMTDWIDVSVTVKHGMPHWPDNPPIVLALAQQLLGVVRIIPWLLVVCRMDAD